MSDEIPGFVVEQDKDKPLWHVVVTWPDDRTETVDGFASEEDAQAWIDGEAEL